MDKDVLSKRRVKVAVNGKTYHVEIVGSLTNSPVTVKVNGRPYLVDMESAERMTKTTHHPTAVRPTAVPLKTPVSSTPTSPVMTGLKAPMPGVILEVFARPGDQVKYGQRLCTLEAMKMKNAIRSPRDGVVATVEVNPGETVAHGQVLFTWEN